MPTLSEIIELYTGHSTPSVLAIKASRLREKLPLLNFTDKDIEHALDTPRVLRQLVRLSTEGEGSNAERAVLAAKLAHELKVLAHLHGEGTPDFGADEMLTIDLDAEVLAYVVAPLLGIKNLSEAPQRRLTTVHGSLYGPALRHVVALPVSKTEDSTAFMAPVVLDTGAPRTYVNKDVLQQLGYSEAVPQIANIYINGLQVVVKLAAGQHVDGINILGADVLVRCQGLVTEYNPNRRVTLRF